MSHLSAKEVEVFWPGKPAEHRRKIAMLLNQVLVGKINSDGEILLTPNARTTDIENAAVTDHTHAYFVALSLSGAAALASGTVWQSSTVGRVTINHDLNAATDRLLGYVLLG